MRSSFSLVEANSPSVYLASSYGASNRRSAANGKPASGEKWKLYLPAWLMNRGNVPAYFFVILYKSRRRGYNKMKFRTIRGVFP